MGTLYVVATLLPLASFLIIALLVATLGDRRVGKLGAYVATAAIAGVFLCSLYGFITYVSQAKPHGHGDAAHAAENGGHQDDHDQHQGGGHHDAEDDGHGPPWKGSMAWAKIYAGGDGDAVELRLGYYIDALGATMFLMVSLIATLIHLFSIGYMGDELQDRVEDHQAHVTRRGRFPRFFMYLSLFCFSMFNLILTDNLFQIFVSWELVGICSFLLISFYYERRSASNAANKAFITNRVGDAGFIIGLMIVWTYFGTFNFQDVIKQVRSPEADSHGNQVALAGQIVRAEATTSTIGGQKYAALRVAESGDQAVLFPLTPPDHFHPEAANKITDPRFIAADPENNPKYRSIPYWLLVLAGIGVFLGCVGKSAQFPLHVWLPDAMEGPTPVSALIHAATMVAAGVYLVGRAFPLFTPEVQLIIAYTGGITLFVAATIAIVQTDIKKVLAYSTVSQLGFMMLALGVGGWVAGLFHLITHAFFKALLFLGSGSVIYGCHHEQDMRKMGGLFPKMRITALTMLVGVLAIAGTPLFSGWYSKDAILVAALKFANANPAHWLLFLLPLLTAGITAFYMFRLWFLTFTGAPKDHHVHEHAHESPPVMTWPLIVLAFFSVTVAWGWNPLDVEGSALEHLLHTAQPGFLAQPFATLPQVRGTLDLAQLAGILALLSAGLGVIVAFVIYYFNFLDPAETRDQFPRVYSFLWNKWRFDELYSVMLVRPALVAAHVARWVDTHLIDGLINFTAETVVWASKLDGLFDKYVVDGLVNLLADVTFAVGSYLRVFQTGSIRNYVLFLAVAAVSIFAVVSYVVALAG